MWDTYEQKWPKIGFKFRKKIKEIFYPSSMSCRLSSWIGQSWTWHKPSCVWPQLNISMIQISFKDIIYLRAKKMKFSVGDKLSYENKSFCINNEKLPFRCFFFNLIYIRSYSFLLMAIYFILYIGEHTMLWNSLQTFTQYIITLSFPVCLKNSI